MIRALVFATICVAVFAQTDPPELHDLNKRVVRDAGVTDVATDMMQGMANVATKVFTDGVNTAQRTFSEAVLPRGKGASDPSRNERRRRFALAQQPPPNDVPSTTAAPPPPPPPPPPQP